MRKNISKYLSFILRHKPESLGVIMDSNGWVDIDDLLSRLKSTGTHIKIEEIFDIVNSDNKGRYIISSDGKKIKAAQGHSIEIDLELFPKEPPEILFHGTNIHAIEFIKKDGLKKMKRHHVHLSKDKGTAITVGSRRGEVVVLTILSKKMHEDGYDFFISENGVWLTNEVPVKYIQF